MSQHLATNAPSTDTATKREDDLQSVTQIGRLMGCLIRINLHDLNTKGVHREQAAEWFARPDDGGASLAYSCRALANLNRYLSAYAPVERSAIPHLDEIMPEDVQDPLAWEEKLQALAQADSLDPEAINLRHKAGYNIETLVDALVDGCRDVHQQLTNEVSVSGATLPHQSDRNGGEHGGFDDPGDFMPMRL